jgi:Zn-dependent protease with chaperone function
MIAQVAPFLVGHLPASDHLPATYPPNYDYKDLVSAESYSRPIVLGGLARKITTILALIVIMLSGVADKSEVRIGSRLRQWLIRLLFLIALFAWLYVVRFPYSCLAYYHDLAFGLTDLALHERLRLLVIGLPIPLALFALKYLLVFCTVPLFKRWWWLGATILLFLLAHVIPEFVSRTLPSDPIRTLTALESGPYATALKQVSQKTGMDLPLFVEDRSERSNTVNIYIAGRSGREYVVLTDTFISSFSPEEAGVALAHELGHHYRGRTSLFEGKILALFKLLVGLGLAAWFAHGIPWRQTTPMRVVLVAMLCLSLTRIAFLPVTNALSRKDERHADRYAIELTGDSDTLQALLVKIAKLNLEPLDLPWWEYYMFSSHPTVLERTRGIRGQESMK